MTGSHGNHYETLGLDHSASVQALETSLDRLISRADRLSYVNQQSSHDAWSGIRQIKSDLLAGPDRRLAYDRSIGIAAGSAPAAGSADRTNRGLVLAPAAALVGLALALLIIMVLPRSQDAPAPAHPLPLGVSTLGVKHGGRYLSGQSVVLTWSRIPHASLYRLQIASLTTRLPDTVAFRHPIRSLVTTKTSYTLSVVGAQLYIWRVQALIHGTWGWFSRSTELKVDKPSIGVPVPRLVAYRTPRDARRVRLCWSRIEGAAGYSIRMSGLGVLKTSQTCTSVFVLPGAYRWSVAATRQGARLYQGAYSSPRTFTVAAPTARPVVRIAARTASTSSRLPVEVAARIPIRTSRAAGGQLPVARSSVPIAATQGQRAYTVKRSHGRRISLHRATGHRSASRRSAARILAARAVRLPPRPAVAKAPVFQRQPTRLSPPSNVTLPATGPVAAPVISQPAPVQMSHPSPGPGFSVQHPVHPSTSSAPAAPTRSSYGNAPTSAPVLQSANSRPTPSASSSRVVVVFAATPAPARSEGNHQNASSGHSKGSKQP